MKSVFRRSFLGLVLLLLGLSCGKSEHNAQATVTSREGNSPAAPGYAGGLLQEEAPSAGDSRARKSSITQGVVDQDVLRTQPELALKPGFVTPALPEERLLEYRLRLSYRTLDFVRARSLLLSVVGKRGFLGETNTSLKERATMHANFSVRATELTEVLKELDGLGVLVREHIGVTDHTESYVSQERTGTREALRARRKAAISSAGLVAKNWSERNAALERSENALDNALQEQWKLRDRAKWARVQIELLGPETAPIVAIPPYRRALVGLVNLALDLSYLLLWLSPLFGLIAIIWLLRRRLEQLIGRLRGRAAAA